MTSRRLIRVEPGITVGMAIGILTVLTLQKSFEIVISATDVARLIIWIIKSLIKTSLLDMSYELSMTNHRERGSAVRASVRIFAGL